MLHCRQQNINSYFIFTFSPRSLKLEQLSVLPGCSRELGVWHFDIPRKPFNLLRSAQWQNKYPGGFFCLSHLWPVPEAIAATTYTTVTETEEKQSVKGGIENDSRKQSERLCVHVHMCVWQRSIRRAQSHGDRFLLGFLQLHHLSIQSQSNDNMLRERWIFVISV